MERKRLVMTKLWRLNHKNKGMCAGKKKKKKKRSTCENSCHRASASLHTIPSPAWSFACVDRCMTDHSKEKKTTTRRFGSNRKEATKKKKELNGH